MADPGGRNATLKLWGVIGLVLAVLSWGGLLPVAKRTLVVLDPFALASLRYIFGTAIFIGVLWLLEGRQALRFGNRLGAAIVYGIIGIAGFNILVWWGLSFTRPEHASVILSMQAPMTAILVWITRGHRPAAFTMGCIAAAITGVALVVTKGDLSRALEGGSLLGDLLVFGGAWTWIIYTLSSSKFPGWSPLRMTVLTCVTGTVALLALNAATIYTGYTELPSLATVWSVRWEMAYFAIFTVVIGILGFNNAAQTLGPLNALLALNFIPVTVFCIEAYLGRSFTGIEIAGATLVVAALVANNLYLRRSPPR